MFLIVIMEYFRKTSWLLFWEYVLFKHLVMSQNILEIRNAYYKMRVLVR
jgi:hypothetical protein